MSGLRRLVPSNLGLKLVALGLALIVYASVYLDEEHEAIVSMPLIVDNTRQDRVLLDSPPERVVAKIVATGRIVLRLKLTGMGNDELVTVVRILPGEEGVDRSLIPSDVVVPLGLDVRVVEIKEPKHLRLRVDELAEKELPVLPRVRGQVPQGFVLSGEVTLDPARVTISGPRTLVEHLEEVYTEPIALEERKGPFNQVSEVVLDRRLRADPEHVRASADVERTAQLEMTGVPVVVRNRRRYETEVDPDSGNVVLLGPASRMRRIRELHDAGQNTGVSIVLDASGLPPGTHVVTPIVELTRELRLVSIFPPRFELQILSPDPPRD